MSWVLAISYWIHLLATIIWLGGIALMLLIAWPALQQGTLASNQWVALQRRFLPWINASLVILLITGFVQMTLDSNYTGFLQVDTVWAWAMLFKHIVFVVMVIIAVYVQAVLYPAMDRLAMLEEKRPQLAAQERDRLERQELRMLRLNMVCAAAVLLLTAIVTAV